MPYTIRRNRDCALRAAIYFKHLLTRHPAVARVFALVAAMVFGCGHFAYAQSTFVRESQTVSERVNVYFYRTINPAVTNSPVEISINGMSVGTLGQGDYIMISARQGNHTLAAKTGLNFGRQYVGPKSIEVKHGNDYFIEIRETNRSETTRTNSLPVSVGKSSIVMDIPAEKITTNIRSWQILERAHGEPPPPEIVSSRKVPPRYSPY